MKILGFLEPRYEPKGSVIYKTVDEVEEMYFVMSGSINIGFEFNRSIKDVLRLTSGSVIGAYNCTYNKKTIFNYSVHSNLDSFIIRNSKWFAFINDNYFNELAIPMRKNITDNYLKKIKEPILNFQRMFLLKKQDQAKADQYAMALVDVKTE